MGENIISIDKKNAKPFLKWAGGKSQLLSNIRQYYPFGDTCTKYAELFVGGGAVLFDVLNSFPNLTEIYINDINAELINAYRVIRDHVEELIPILLEMQCDFVSADMEHRKIIYLANRNLFNKLKTENKTQEKNNEIQKAALMIFLNRTCFNGLFRVNKKGMFNVSMGSYKNPLICDKSNLQTVSDRLQSVSIMRGGYKEAGKFIDEKTFVYLDPPYRPITTTANFTSYSSDSFCDQDQFELADFVKEIHKKRAKFLMSNSDPKNSDTDDNFFDELYSEYYIDRVFANRMINCKAKKRGKIAELLISNFEIEKRS